MIERTTKNSLTSGVVLAAVWLLSAFLVLVFLFQSLAYLRFPYDLDYCEGCVLTDAVNLFNGTGMYGPVQGVPAGVSIYPPLFQFLAGLVIRVVGPSLAVTRGLSLGCTLVLAALLALLVRRFSPKESASRWMPLLGAACFLATNFVYEWAPLGRIDMLAIALSAGAIYAASGKSPNVYLAAALSILGIYTKQTSLAAPAAIAAYLLWTDWRAAVKFMVTCAVAGLAILAGLQKLTHGLFFFHIFTAAFTQAVSSKRAASLEWNFLRQHVFFFLLSVSWAVRAIVHRADEGRGRLLALWLSTSLIMTWTGGNQGSSVNYYIEAIACMSALAVLELDRLRRTEAGALAPALILLQLIFLIHVPYRLLGTEALPYPPLGYTPRPRDYAVGQAIDRYIRQAKGPVLIEDAGYAVRNGRMPLVENPIFLIMLQYHGRFDTKPMLGAIARGDYALVVVNWPGALPMDMLNAIEASYREIDVLKPGGNRFPYHVFAPNRGEKPKS